MDIDLAILGSSPDRYKAMPLTMRREYAMLQTIFMQQVARKYSEFGGWRNLVVKYTVPRS